MSERDLGDEVFVDGIEREGASEGEEHEEVPVEAVEDPISGDPVGLQSLDEVDWREVFKRRTVVMKSPPFYARFLQGSHARSSAGAH